MKEKYTNIAVLANPAAQGLHQGRVLLNPDQKEALKKLSQSAHIAITEEDLGVLRIFYEKTKEQPSKLGALYKTLNFEQFIERLVIKRFDQAYLDGRQIFPRQYTDDNDPLRLFFRQYPQAQNSGNGSFNRRHLLDLIGTDEDTFEIYKEYLSLAELSVSGMILMTTTDVVLGRGGRGKWSDNWYDINAREAFYKEQAKDTALAAVFSYPAGIEFRNNTSASLDTVYCLISKNTGDELSLRRNIARSNQALGETLHGLYGTKSALSFATYDNAQADLKANPGDWLSIDNGNLLLYKPSYSAKIERILRQIILAHDQSMAELGLGKVLNLKGLGLGAFGIRGYNEQLEQLFVEALCKVHGELAGGLQYITGINLINPPRLFRPDQRLPTPLINLSDKKYGVRLTENCMDPTTQYIVSSGNPGYGTQDYEVGGVVFCGDPASLPGNEARVCHRLSGNHVALIGLSADSSDDPAQLYAMAQPTAYDPIANPIMLENQQILSSKKPPKQYHNLDLPRAVLKQIKDKLSLPLRQEQEQKQEQTEAKLPPEISMAKPSIQPAPLLKKPTAVILYPKTYYKLYKSGKTEIESIRNLLDDYTKHNSCINRFFSGHWNRHHVYMVNCIVEEIKGNTLVKVEDILHRLNNIPNKNPAGSLARRIAFIEQYKNAGEESNFRRQK